jgi:hypothetical protein
VLAKLLNRASRLSVLRRVSGGNSAHCGVVGTG